MSQRGRPQSGRERGSGNSQTGRAPARDDDSDEEPQSAGRGRGRGGPAARGRGGRGMPKNDSDEEEQPQMSAPRGRGGAMVVRGRGAAAPADDDDDDDDDDDSDYDPEDDDEGDDEEEEEIPDPDATELQNNFNVLKELVTNPGQATPAVVLGAFKFFSDPTPNIKSKTGFALFNGEQPEGTDILKALLRALSGAAPLAGFAWDQDTKLAAVIMFQCFSSHKGALDVIVENGFLPLLLQMFEELTTRAEAAAAADKQQACDVLENALQILDCVLQYNTQRQEIAAMFAANMVNPDAEDEDAAQSPVDVAKLMGKDVREDIARLGFVEFCAKKLNGVSEEVSLIVMDLMYQMVSQTDDLDEEMYNPAARFVKEGGLIALCEGLNKEMDIMVADKGDFKHNYTMLALRLAAGMMLNDSAATLAIGATDMCNAIDKVFSQIREKYFDADEPMEENDENLVECATEFVTIYTTELSNCRKLMNDTEVFDSLLNFLEHAALGETNLEVSGPLREMALESLSEALSAESDEPKSQREFLLYLCEHDSAIDTLLELMEQGNAEVDPDDDEAMAKLEERQNEPEKLANILEQLGATKEGVDALVKKNVHTKMFHMFDTARADADGAEDPDEQDMAYMQMADSLGVLVNLATAAAVQKMLFDKKVEPHLRKIIANDEGNDYVRAQALNLCASLTTHDKWVTAFNAKPKDFIEKPGKLLTHFSYGTRSAALCFIGAMAKAPVLAASVSSKQTLLDTLFALANGHDDHDEKPEREDEDEGEDEDDEDEEDEEDLEDEDDEDEEDPDAMAVYAMSALVNLARNPAAAPKLAASPAFIEAIEYALGEEQDDGALRSLAAICIAQFTMTDKENKYTPAVLLAMLDGVVPTELPKLKDEEVKETEEDEDGDETPQLDLDPSLEWEVDTDVFPLLSSTHPAAQRLGAYYLALIARNPKLKDLLSQLPAAGKASLDALAGSADALTSTFAKLSLSGM